MTTRRQERIAGTALALFAIVASTIPSALAQEATPAAQEATPVAQETTPVAQEATPVAQPVAIARPAHIHSGDCVELGEIVAPLVDLTAPIGEGAGQADEASPAESSFTANVPLTIDAMLAADHAINVHLSTEQIETYIACGELGGVVDAGGALVIGLRELSASGYTGIAFLSPAADGVSTDVSVFIAPVFGAAG